MCQDHRRLPQLPGDEERDQRLANLIGDAILGKQCDALDDELGAMQWIASRMRQDCDNSTTAVLCGMVADLAFMLALTIRFQNIPYEPPDADTPLSSAQEVPT